MARQKHGLAVVLWFCLAWLFLGAGYFVHNPYTQTFLCLFIFRYFRLFVGIVAYFLHKTVAVSADSKFKARDVTVILPTVNPSSRETLETIKSVLESGVARLIVVIPWTNEEEAKTLLYPHVEEGLLKDGRLKEVICDRANKRYQVSCGLEAAQEVENPSPIVVLVDDHVWWPKNYLDNLLAPFINDTIGGVATWKTVKRNCRKSWSLNDLCNDFCNFLGCLYLERHNFDITASHFVDGGLFVISGRTAAYRASIICNPAFIKEFCNETFWLLGRVGPLNADDDNFITRWLVSRGWQIGWQHGADATIETTLGDSGFQKFNAQCLRWSRTTWRSNTRSLMVDGVVWWSQPWSVYSVYLTSLVNFALFMDAALVLLCWQSGNPVVFIVVWIMISKLIKPIPHFLRNPGDLVYILPYFVFGYYHSLLKLYALFTVRVTAWGSRPGVVQ